MVKITQEIYKEMKKDIPKIEEAMKTKKGSRSLWERLRARYSVLIPGSEKHVKKSGKIAGAGQEFDYRPELKQLKEALLAYLIIHPVEEQSNDDVVNESSQLLHEDTSSSIDETINQKIEESKIYIRSKNSNKKQIALEKIWQSFERLKTIYGENKRKSITTLINKVSYDSEKTKGVLQDEFKILTDIGNTYQIRHFENGTEPIPTDSFKEYLYFRILSLISYCLQEINTHKED